MSELGYAAWVSFGYAVQVSFGYATRVCFGLLQTLLLLIKQWKGQPQTTRSDQIGSEDLILWTLSPVTTHTYTPHVWKLYTNHVNGHGIIQ